MFTTVGGLVMVFPPALSVIRCVYSLLDLSPSILLLSRQRLQCLLNIVEWTQSWFITVGLVFVLVDSSSGLLRGCLLGSPSPLAEALDSQHEDREEQGSKECGQAREEGDGSEADGPGDLTLEVLEVEATSIEVGKIIR